MTTDTTRLEAALENAMQVVSELTRIIAAARVPNIVLAPVGEAPPVARSKLDGVTALEIGALVVAGKVKNLPKDRGGILKRATDEGWRFELRSGRGGKTKVFKLPAKYIV